MESLSKFINIHYKNFRFLHGLFVAVSLILNLICQQLDFEDYIYIIILTIVSIMTVYFLAGIEKS